MAGSGDAYKRVGSAVAGAWPILATFTLFLILCNNLGTGSSLDAYTWPSALYPSCAPKDKQCLAISNMDAMLRIATMCAAAFPLANSYNHIRTLRDAAKDADKSNKLLVGFAELALISVYLSVVLNLFWIGVIWDRKFNHNDEWIVVVMFGVFAIADLLLMGLHSPSKNRAPKGEFLYFFGSAFYIDVPTLAGVFLIMKFSTTFVSVAFGSAGVVIAQALTGGAIVMHVAVSQIVFVFLQTQLSLDHTRPAFSEPPGTTPLQAA